MACPKVGGHNKWYLKYRPTPTMTPMTTTSSPNDNPTVNKIIFPNQHNTSIDLEAPDTCTEWTVLYVHSYVVLLWISFVLRKCAKTKKCLSKTSYGRFKKFRNSVKFAVCRLASATWCTRSKWNLAGESAPRGRWRGVSMGAPKVWN